MSSTSPRSYPFATVNAFTRDSFRGNPATVIFLNPSDPLTKQECLKFARGSNQPIVVFLVPTSHPAKKPGVVSFEIQYFTPRRESELCGHGTIAALKVILDSATNSTVEFTTANGVVIAARKVIVEAEDWFELVLPAGKLKDLPAEEEERVLEIFIRAMGREPRVRYFGMGEPPFQRHLLVVLEESENLDQLKFADIKALEATGFHNHITTTDSTSGKFPEDYITRMFAPAAGVDEDHVCGSANCTMGPYWSAQKGIAELKVRQVSERGGQLRVGVYGDRIRLRGQAKVTNVGWLFL